MKSKRDLRTLLSRWLSKKIKYETIFWGSILVLVLIPCSVNPVLGEDTQPPLGNINVPPGFELTTKHFQVHYTDGNTYWACLVLNNNISVDSDAPKPEFYYNHNRRLSWLVLKEDGSIEEDKGIFQDVALAAQAAFLAVTNANPGALREEAERYDNVLIATAVAEILNAYGYIAGETISALITGGSSSIVKGTAKAALKATAQMMIMETAKKILEENLTIEGAWKNVLRTKIVRGSQCLNDLAATDFTPVYGDIVEYDEAVDFYNGVVEGWKEGRGGVFGLMVYHEDGLSDYLKSVLKGVVPSPTLEYLLDDPTTRRSLDFVATWQCNLDMMGKGTAEGVELVQSAFILAADGPGPSLLAYWNFDEGSGSIVSDSSGNGNDGTIYGAAWTAGRIGYALGFDGINDWVDIPDDISPGNITLEAWIYPTGFDDGPGDQGNPIITKETGRGTPPWSESFAWRLRITPRTHKLQLQCFTPTGSPGGGSVISDTVLEMGNWYHVAGTYDGTRTKVYIDGNIEGSYTASISEPLVTSNLPTAIGHLPNWSVQWFQGIIDEARIYDKALPDSEIEMSADVEPSAPAPQPVDDLVSVSMGRVGYDRRTGQFSVNVTITNMSVAVIGSPAAIVIETISSPNVNVANADGTTSDGKPYIELSGLLENGVLCPGESVATRVCFNNPNRVRFTFQPSVWGVILP